MPGLPPALAARLAKRGLVEQSEVKKAAPPTEEVEEVFAEDYDDPTQPPTVPEDSVPDIDMQTDEPEEEPEPEESGELIYETIACPNKSNQFHECVDYCKTRWGHKKFDPDKSQNRKIDRMLRKYPLPEGWIAVGDPSTSRYYYWNTETDQVSWLSPAHPRAEVTFSAEKLKELMESAQGESERQTEEDMDTEHKNIEDQDFEELERELMREKRRRDRRGRDRDRDRDRRRDRDMDELDPMDPASYSDIPRGTWSTGLDQRGSAKTGVDATASGPLFQQRPYPSPGAVLRANKALDED